MIVVLWRTDADAPAGDIAEWPFVWPHRIVVEYASAKLAWRVAVVEMKDVALWSDFCKHGYSTGVLRVRNTATGMLFAQRIFETGSARMASQEPGSPRIPTPAPAQIPVVVLPT